MNKLSHQTHIKKKLHSLTTAHNNLLQTQFNHSTRITKPHAPRLRVLNIITPKPKPSSINQTHLKLIHDFLQTDSDHHSFQTTHLGVSDSNHDPLIDPKKFLEPHSVSINVSRCASSRDLRNGVQYHGLGFKTGFLSNVYVGTSLLCLYGRCGNLDDAYKVFDEMPVKNVVSWTAVISVFSQECRFDVCMAIYRRMKVSDSKPNHFTYTSVLSACTSTGALTQGRNSHCHVIQSGFDSYTHIANALISMYCKCGSVSDAFYVFNSTRRKDNVSWNSMIVGYAQHGLALQAINLFEKMKNKRIKPDAITFLGVLSSCRHAGLIDQGKVYVDLMVDYGIEPELDHCSCIVDLLGRAGLIKPALDFIKKMKMRPNAVIWGSLLSACRLHGNVWIGIKAAENRLLLEPGCVATHVQLANLYASVGYWDRTAEIRKMIRDKGLKTNPGCSWIEIKDKVHKFAPEDKADIRMIEILSIMDCLVDDMRTFGRVNELNLEQVDDALLS